MVLAHNVKSVERTADIKINTEATFQTLMLSKSILDGLTSAGFSKPSPIQLLGIPLGKLGLDLILEAKSGTGKTVVFTTIALQKLNLTRGLQVIIVTPTREIAAQICDVLKQIGSHCNGLKVEMVIGGLSFKEDLEKLKNNVHILVGTPGRLLHLIREKHIIINEIHLLILDEADKLLENNFESDIQYLHSALPKEKQVILSSATYPDGIAKVVTKLFKNLHHVCPETSSILLGVSHRVTFVKCNSNSECQTKLRFNELTKILTKTEFKQCVIFCKYQARVSQLHKLLTKAKWPVELVYGKQEQTTRLEALKTLQEYKCRIIVSTDLLSRGIDSKNVDLVINFEPPDTCETYLHRIGRSGRYGSIGMAISIICEGQETINWFKLLSPITHTIDIKHFWTGDTLNKSHYLTSNSNETENESRKSDHIGESEQKSDSCDIWKSLVSETATDSIESFDQLCNSYNTVCDTAKIESFSELLHDFSRTDNFKNESESTFRHLEFKHSNYRDNFDEINKLKGKLNQFNFSSDSKTDFRDEEIVLHNGNFRNNENNGCLNTLCEPYLPEHHNNSNSYRNELEFELELPKAFNESKFNFKAKNNSKNKHQRHTGKSIKNLNLYSYDNAEYRHDAFITEERDIKSSNVNLRIGKKNKPTTNHSKAYNQPTSDKSEYLRKEKEYNKWLHQLKLRMKQIETILYIEEMSK